MGMLTSVSGCIGSEALEADATLSGYSAYVVPNGHVWSVAVLH